MCSGYFIVCNIILDNLRIKLMWLSIHEVSEKLDLSIDTIRRWEKKGLIKAERSDKIIVCLMKKKLYYFVIN